MNPLSHILSVQRAIIMDGGLATELERMGHDLRHPLWSAKVLMTDPQDIIQVHKSFMASGADMIASTSYQLSFPGCAQIGLSKAETVDLIRRSIALAAQARSEFTDTSLDTDRSKPLIGASLGPYGAYLANGAEYTGDYGVSSAELSDFHKARLAIVDDTEADLIMFETIPSITESLVLQKLIADVSKEVCISFTCKNDTQVRDNTPIEKCVSLFNHVDNVVAVGVNCTQPKYVHSIIEKMRLACPSKEIMAYPNSGEVYDGQDRSWKGRSDIQHFAEYSKLWHETGATVIGGCCRTSPSHIQAVRNIILA